MALTDSDRREIADRHIEGLRRNSQIASQEGDHRSAANFDDEIAEWDFWAIHGISRAQWDEREAEDEAREKRYEILDQNGDRLDWFDAYEHAAHYLRGWLGPHPTSEHNGAGVWDREEQTWARRFESQED